MKLFGRQRKNSFDSLPDERAFVGNKEKHVLRLSASADEADKDVDVRDDIHGGTDNDDNRSISSNATGRMRLIESLRSKKRSRSKKPFKTMGFRKSRYNIQREFDSDDMSAASEARQTVESPRVKVETESERKKLPRSGSFRLVSPHRTSSSPRNWFQRKDNEKSTISNMGLQRQEENEPRDDSLGTITNPAGTPANSEDPPRQIVPSPNAQSEKGQKTTQGQIDNAPSADSFKPVFPPRGLKHENDEEKVYSDKTCVENVLSSGSIKPYVPPVSLKKQASKEELIVATVSSESIKAPPRGFHQPSPKQMLVKTASSGSIKAPPRGIQPPTQIAAEVLKTASSGSLKAPPRGIHHPPTPPKLKKTPTSESIKAPPRGIQPPTQMTEEVVKTASSGSIKAPPRGFQQPQTPQELKKTSSSESIKASPRRVQPTQMEEEVVKTASSGSIKAPPRGVQQQTPKADVIVTSASSASIKPPPRGVQPQEETDTSGPQEDLRDEKIVPPPPPRQAVTPRNLPIVETVGSNSTLNTPRNPPIVETVGSNSTFNTYPSGIAILSMSTVDKGEEMTHQGDLQSKTVNIQREQELSRRLNVSKSSSHDSESGNLVRPPRSTKRYANKTNSRDASENSELDNVLPPAERDRSKLPPRRPSLVPTEDRSVNKEILPPRGVQQDVSAKKDTCSDKVYSAKVSELNHGPLQSKDVEAQSICEDASYTLIDEMVEAGMTVPSTESPPRASALDSPAPPPKYPRRKSGASARSMESERIEIDLNGKPSDVSSKLANAHASQIQSMGSDIRATTQVLSDPGSYEAFETCIIDCTTTPQKTVSCDVEAKPEEMKPITQTPNDLKGIRGWFRRRKPRPQDSQVDLNNTPFIAVDYEDLNVDQMEQAIAQETSSSLDEMGPPRKLERSAEPKEEDNREPSSVENVEPVSETTSLEQAQISAPVLEATYTKKSEDSEEIQKVPSDSFQAIAAIAASPINPDLSVTAPPLKLERAERSRDIESNEDDAQPNEEDANKTDKKKTGQTENKQIDPESFHAIEEIVNAKSSSSKVFHPKPAQATSTKASSNPVVSALEGVNPFSRKEKLVSNHVVESRRAESPVTVNFDDVNDVEKMLVAEPSRSFAEQAPPTVQALQTGEPKKAKSSEPAKEGFLAKIGKPWQLFWREKDNSRIEVARSESKEKGGEATHEVELTEMVKQGSKHSEEESDNSQGESCQEESQKKSQHSAETREKTNVANGDDSRSKRSKHGKVIPITVEEVKSAISGESDVFSGFDNFFGFNGKKRDSSLAVNSDFTGEQTKRKTSCFPILVFGKKKNEDNLDQMTSVGSESVGSISTWKYFGRKAVVNPDLRHGLLSAEERLAAKESSEEKSGGSSRACALLLFVLLVGLLSGLSYSFIKNRYSILDHDFFVDWEKKANVAFIGGAYLVINDVPRLTQSLSNGHITQNSVLHPSVGSISRILATGNGMYYQWQTNEAFTSTHRNDYGFNVADYDFGLCTVKQLLLGQDQDLFDGETYVNDGRNPCYIDEYYYEKVEEKLKERYTSWDYVVLADQTKRMAIDEAREYTTEALVDTYAPMIQYSGATPVIVDTHAFWSDEVNVTNAVDIPSFQALIYEGAQEYAEALANELPEDQAPLIAPAGLAFLLVYEDDQSQWEKLISGDGVHASVHGSYLIACVIYATIYGHLPEKSYSTSNLEEIFANSRKIYDEEITYPSTQEANYYRGIARRVALLGEMPASFSSDMTEDYRGNVEDQDLAEDDGGDEDLNDEEGADGAEGADRD